MSFNEFCSKLFYPALVTIGGFLTVQFFTSFVGQAEFAAHKIQQVAEISKIVTRLDFIIEQQAEIKELVRGQDARRSR